MKKYAFMFVAAAAMCFAACGEKKAAQDAEVAEVEEVVEDVIDSAAAWALVGDTAGLDSAAIAEKFAAAVDSLKAAAPAEEATEE